MTTTTSSHDETTNGITLAWSLELMEKFGNNEVPDDGRRYVIVGWEQWSQLMAIDQFSRVEYVGPNECSSIACTTKLVNLFLIK